MGHNLPSFRQKSIRVATLIEFGLKSARNEVQRTCCGRGVMGEGKPSEGSTDFLLILGTHSESFLGISRPKRTFFSYLFPGCFSDDFWVISSFFGHTKPSNRT